MIYAFTGKTGSGKTYNMVKLAYRYWLGGVDVYTNTVLYFDKPFTFLEKTRFFLKKFFNKDEPELKRGRIIYYSNINELIEVHDGLILFDEAQVLFDAQNWASLPSEFKFKLQQHRKHNLDLFCTTQSINTIDITYRRLVQHWFYYKPIFSLFGLNIFREDYKDVEFLYKDNSDLTVPSLSSRIFLIGRFSPILYDTLYDVGFEKIKPIWQLYNGKSKLILTDRQMMSKSV